MASQGKSPAEGGLLDKKKLTLRAQKISSRYRAAADKKRAAREAAAQMAKDELDKARNDVFLQRHNKSSSKYQRAVRKRRQAEQKVEQVDQSLDPGTEMDRLVEHFRALKQDDRQKRGKQQEDLRRRTLRLQQRRKKAASEAAQHDHQFHIPPPERLLIERVPAGTGEPHLEDLALPWHRDDFRPKVQWKPAKPVPTGARFGYTAPPRKLNLGGRILSDSEKAEEFERLERHRRAGFQRSSHKDVMAPNHPRAWRSAGGSRGALHDYAYWRSATAAEKRLGERYAMPDRLRYNPQAEGKAKWIDPKPQETSYFSRPEADEAILKRRQRAKTIASMRALGMPEDSGPLQRELQEQLMEELGGGGGGGTMSGGGEKLAMSMALSRLVRDQTQKNIANDPGSAAAAAQVMVDEPRVRRAFGIPAAALMATSDAMQAATRSRQAREARTMGAKLRASSERPNTRNNTLGASAISQRSSQSLQLVARDVAALPSGGNRWLGVGSHEFADVAATQNEASERAGSPLARSRQRSFRLVSRR